MPDKSYYGLHFVDVIFWRLMKLAYRVILVDDEPWALKDLEITFPWAKYDFTVSGSYLRSDEALQAILLMRPDVIVADLLMPVHNGIDLLRKARECNVNSVFVLVSGVSDFEAARNAIHYGIVEYCLKPLLYQSN